MEVHLADAYILGTFLLEVLPQPFHYSLGSYLYLFFVTHFTKSKLIARSVPVLKLPKKKYIPSYKNIFATKKSRVSAKNIGIKVPTLQPS